ncbi:luciferase family protein [Pseudonocardia sp. Ae406_Ps2]|uniref:LLM class flavin-dependent oxidoreductase n=1 Tax=unclassified Pseudonocardia TaxID=2619320 RepID=UPI00094B0062|nr:MULTISPECIES: LLM class flavin-dependent oxidoreductase [unclassified Pseudonocardia]OLM01291.1 luciferase family protein [Pseudonocardia sp. Ae406_Ps2]OLM06912.1 luciferase family protein [Pseudonocardia sp. Ae331_Ps2]OLM14088.1 luciferase family protein [Pseudonocardia sp. Ae505_Ps2]OLM22864.1 luciferase family protein [Pseudonocardia sp. Ae706_Ps2]OLM31266.1 luciferase family protein [Pseudonocardia sp. Ae717_Ps2]
MRLGFLTHVHGDEPAGALFAGVVELFVAAEELGYDTGWVAQHHLQPRYGRLPSPLVLLAAVAERTHRIRLGTAVSVLPLEDPLRLAEDVAVLDALSGGRLELGLGSGGPSAAEFAAFGAVAADRRADYDRALPRLVNALAGRPLPGSGGLVLQPSSDRAGRRLWESSTRVDTVAAGAAAGRGLLLGVGPHDLVQRELAETHRAHWRGTGPAPIAAVRGIFPDRDRRAARERLAPDIARYLPHHVAAGWAREDTSIEELLALMNVQYGTPDDIVEGLAADAVFRPHATDLIAAVQAESTSLAEARRGLEVLATEIAPRLGRVAA